MRRPIAIVFAFLIVYWTAAPLLACVVPGGVMTPQEHACCKHMAEMCGSPNMPQSHSCCTTEVRPNSTTAVTSEQQSVPALQTVATVSVSPEPQLCERLPDINHHHPPGEFLPDTTVLRI
jgi:hypothetical protein